MATSPQGPQGLPSPGEQGESQQGPGPGPGGGFPSPAPAQPDPNREALVHVRGIVQGTRMLAQRYPAVAGEARQINDLIARILQKIQQSGPAPQPAAPPV